MKVYTHKKFEWLSPKRNLWGSVIRDRGKIENEKKAAVRSGINELGAYEKRETVLEIGTETWKALNNNEEPLLE